MQPSRVFDPRHDPPFQRGYDPAVPADRRDAASPRLVDQTGARQEAPAHPAGPAAQDGLTYSHLGLVEPGLGPAGTHWPRRNPYLRALWAVGVALIVVGIVLAWQVTADSANITYSGGEMPFALILQQLAWTVVPSMVTVGIATIVALIF
jgi:hypothetical protein